MIWKLKLLLKSIVFMGAVIFIYGVIFDASSSNTGEDLSIRNKARLKVDERLQAGLSSAKVELEGPKSDDYQKILRYNKRYWDLSGQNVSFESNTSESIMYNDLDNLWRPREGQSEAGGNDRIIQQLVWAMEAANSSFSNRIKEKRILLWDKAEWWSEPALHSNCPNLPGSVGHCLFTDDRSTLNLTDAVITTQDSEYWAERIPEHVLKIFCTLESPFHSTTTLKRTNDLLATYWRGSGIVAPYNKWLYYDLSKKLKPHGRNYASGKTKPVAIFVSNCRAWNNRMGYIEELKKSIEVDVYGSCGSLDCPRSKEKTCFEMLQKDYYFYLSFENSNCRDYITEKLFINALQNDVIPVVMGAHPDDYKAVAPYKSYIHIEDFGDPKELAEYMKFLINNPIKYNEYFEWKGAGKFILTEFFCRLCAMVHYADFMPPPKREKQESWDRISSVKNGMCLGRDVWYWTKNATTYNDEGTLIHPETSTGSFTNTI